MSFFSILAALLIEQARPLGPNSTIQVLTVRLLRWVARHLDTGATAHAWLAWSSVVLGLSALSVLFFHALNSFLGWPFALAFNVCVLYATLGFRQFSHVFTQTRDALERGETDRAAALLSQWQRTQAGELQAPAVIRLLIEHSVLASHRYVFGVLGWFAVLAFLGLGPAGAVLYRVSDLAARHWHSTNADSRLQFSAALCSVARKAWDVVDWAPARVTALCFAVVGSFEEAVDGWRRHAQQFPQDSDGVVLSAAAGALGARLGAQRWRAAFCEAPMPALQSSDSLLAGQTVGVDPEPAHLRAMVGLVWRSVVLWMLLIALVSLARLTG